MGVLASSEQVPVEGLGEYLVIGELSLDGSLRAVSGVLAIESIEKLRDRL